MKPKVRLTISVDADVAEAAEAAVAGGQAPSVSAWFNRRMASEAETDARLRALDEYLEGYEREFGPITEEDLAETERWKRANAIRVR